MATLDLPRKHDVDNSAARDASLTLRRERAAIKTALRAGRVTLTDLMDEPPSAMADVMLIEVLRWARVSSSSRRQLAMLGGWALRDGVNLMLPVGHAPMLARAWVAEHGTYGLRLPT